MRLTACCLLLYVLASHAGAESLNNVPARPAAPSAAAAPAFDSQAIVTTFSRAEQWQGQIAEQHARLGQEAKARRAELEKHHEAILKNTLDQHKAMADYYEKLHQDALQRMEYLQAHDAELFGQALQSHDAEAARQNTLKTEAETRAARLKTLRTEFEALPAAEQSAFMDRNIAELHSLTTPAPYTGAFGESAKP